MGKPREAVEVLRERVREWADRYLDGKGFANARLYEILGERASPSPSVPREVAPLVAEWESRAETLDNEASAPTKNDDERRTALAKLVVAQTLRDCAKALRLLGGGADTGSGA